MIAPLSVEDDFGVECKPKANFLRYVLELRYDQNPEKLTVEREQLSPLQISEAAKLLGFEHSGAFRKSALTTPRRRGPFISTDETTKDRPGIQLHQDGGSRGRAIPVGRSPRTVVGGTNAAEFPTVLAARREMASWRIFQLEPSVMRSPDPIGGEDRIDERGAHLAAAIERLRAAETGDGRILQTISNRLGQLLPEVRSIRIERDERVQRLSLMMKIKGCEHELGPMSLSDGTLRFLVLATLAEDPEASGVVCMEEPENGVHPSRVPVMCELLRDLCVDPKEEVNEDNPLRQVIVNTHSPDVVSEFDYSEILFVRSVDSFQGIIAKVFPVDDGKERSSWRLKYRRELRGVPLREVIDYIGGTQRRRARLADEKTGDLKHRKMKTTLDLPLG